MGPRCGVCGDEKGWAALVLVAAGALCVGDMGVRGFCCVVVPGDMEGSAW